MNGVYDTTTIALLVIAALALVAVWCGGNKR